MEKALFPMKYLNVTQGMNTGTHKGSFEIDTAGKDSGIDNVYAPFTGVIKKTYPVTNEVWLESVNPVKYADGTEDYMTILFSHDNDISDLYVGKKIKQGEVFYQEGTRGNATGNHIQINVGRGKFTKDGWHKNEYGNWVINNEIDPTKALWLSKDTVIINDGGYKWKRLDEDTTNDNTTKDNTYTVKKGDTLSGIAKKYNMDWHILYEFNKDVVGNNPNLIIPGQVLTIPSNNIYYIVVKGDTLSKIAKKYNTTWQKIYNDNKNVIGKDPNLILPGQKLIIKI